MIPKRLEIHNFLPYRAPDPIRFDGIHLACLTGANGAGKSSLLDAITWALWGKARAKRDEELIHLGQGEMSVQLDFEQEGVTYRVFRQRSSGKKGEGRLNFLILHEDGTKTTQNEPSIRQTQEKINALLRLDYDTFTASAFLQQGRADAFTTRTPAQRKQILSDILGLEQWAAYEDAVKEHEKTLEGQIRSLRESIREDEANLARRPMLERDLAEATQTHADAKHRLEIAQEHLESLRYVPTKLDETKEKLKDYDRRLGKNLAEQQEAQSDLDRRHVQIAEYEAVLANRDEIEQGYAALRNAREVDQTLNVQLKQLLDLNRARADLEAELAGVRVRLQTQADGLRTSIAALMAASQADPSADLEAVMSEVSALEMVRAQRDVLGDQIAQRREDKAALEADLKALKQDGLDLGARLKTLQETDSAVCPLCGQPLEADHLANTLAQLEAEITAMREAYRQKQEASRAQDTGLKHDRAQLEALESELKRLSPLMERAGGLQAQVDALRQNGLRLAEDQDQLAQIEAALDEEDFAPDVRQQLALLNEQHAQIGYDERTHDDTRQQLEQHLRYEQLRTQLEVAAGALKITREAAEGDARRLERLAEVHAEISADQAAALEEQARLEVLAEEYKVREDEVKREHTRERSAYERKVNAEQELRSLADVAERKAQREERLRQASYHEGLLGELRRAFGKNGIPAMMIESAIPELEANANALLAQMTDGRMALKMNTQREKITGGTAETLDIEIADELGTRSYELYSGGEAFRINFAVRVALSQMLAHRAGAQLRTLFIDEGFGTQDEEGRSKLVEAITVIQDKFELILVITHIDELRDSFPVHIVVNKTPNGSAVMMQ